jgi:glycosyltransferase involved in cell wall biosynthesis
MRLLLVTNQLDLGGAERFVVRLANELARRGHAVHVASSGGPLAAGLLPDVGQWEVDARAKSPWGVWHLSRQLGSLMTGLDVDLVHVQSPTTAIAARLARPHPHLPILASAHGVWSPHVLPGVAHLFGWGADRVVGCSQAITAELVRVGLRRDRARTIPNGIPMPTQPPDRARCRAELGWSSDEAIILSAARLTPQKGLRHLLEALPALLRRFPHVRWIVAGEGPLGPALRQRAEQLGVLPAVRFLGPRPDMERLMAASDLFCLPSLKEGLPLAIAEAMAWGLPVVATTVGGVPEIVQDGVTGFLVPPAHPGLLGARLAELLGDPEHRSRMGRAGLARVREVFRLDAMVSAFEALYARELATAWGSA